MSLIIGGRLVVPEGFSYLPPAKCALCDDNGWVFFSATDKDGLHGNFCKPCTCEAGRAVRNPVKSEFAAADAALVPPKMRDYTFENWKAREGDAVCQRLSRVAGAYARDFHNHSEGALFYGPSGCGKTHLAVATLIAVGRRGFSTLFKGVPRLLMEIRAAQFDTGPKNQMEILEELSYPDLLVLDDLGAEKVTEWVEGMLYLIISTRYDMKRAMIVTTNNNLVELENHLGSRVVSRLKETCPVGEFSFPARDWRRTRG